MKVTIIISDITKTGGTERAAINLANMISGLYIVCIVSLGKEGKVFFPIENSVKIKFLGIGGPPISWKDKISWYWKGFKTLKKAIAIEAPNIILGEGHNISVFLPLIKNPNSKTIASEHIDYESIPSVSRKLMQIIYPKLNGIVVLSEIAKRKIDGLNEKIQIIPNALPFTVESRSNLANKTIIMVGRISKEKGYERVIPIAKRMETLHPEWKINIFGDGDQKDSLLDLIKVQNVSNVFINNPVKNIKEEYLNSSILMITSYHEAMPMVILEAQSCGLPVIGYFCEGTASLLSEGKTGYVVDSENDFVDKLTHLIENTGLRNEIGVNAKKAVEIYKREKIRKQWINLFENLN